MNQREKTIAMFVGVAVGLYAVDQWLLEPYFDDLNKADDQIARHQHDLSDGNDVLQRRVASMKHWKEISTGKIEADSSTAAAAAINRIQECARDARLTITSYTTEKADKEKGYDRVSIKPTAEGNMQAIGRFLFQLRQSDIPVRIGDIQISAKKEGVDDLTLSLTLTTIISSTAAPPTKVAVSWYGREGLQ